MRACIPAVLAAVALLLSASALASQGQQEADNQCRDPVPVPNYYADRPYTRGRVIDSHDAANNCHGGRGCFRIEGNDCLIFYPPNCPNIRAHEYAHCVGWRHIDQDYYTRRSHSGHDGSRERVPSPWPQLAPLPAPAP